MNHDAKVMEMAERDAIRRNPRRDNSNRARDHLANERTYLAWMRTAISLMGFGVVIVRLRYLLPAQIQGHSHGWQLGLLFALVGIFMVLMANAHYFHVRRALEEETYEPEGRWILLCTVSIVLIGTGIVYYLLTSPVIPSPH